ncbi:acyloxyacyl hydrolase [Magnetococcus sp. PR-3]|uniref:acyloxyacyl hydrolase n=1 Tax=Magnetococcus sp. PR-3 TaxID=3120355 RepID=UPI002FCE14AC
MKKHMLVAMSVCAGLCSPPLHAQEVGPELRLGAMLHDIDFLSFNREGGQDLNGEILFATPRLLSSMGSPRPHVGFALNSDGYTSQLYTGLTWHHRWLNQLFVEGSLGGTVHNGDTLNYASDRKSLGSQVLFRLSASVGYQLTKQNSLSLMVDHISNAYLADENEGLDTIGLRIGHRF